MGEGIQNIQCSPRNIRNTKPEKPYQTHPNTDYGTQFLADIKEINNAEKIRAISRSKSVSKNIPSSKKGSGMMSISDIRKRIKLVPKVLDKKPKLVPSVAVDGRQKRKVFGQKSKPLLVNKTFTVISDKDTEVNKSDKIIELYHNSAVKMVTASEDSLAINKRVQIEQQVSVKQHPVTAMHTYQRNQTIHESNINQHNKQQEYPKQMVIPQQIEMVTHQYTQAVVLSSRKTVDGASIYSKNYELPTIASKMKQVAKNYFQNFTFKTIPFVAATSCSPSHNLGLNIQQVLSIMKGRKPLMGISPTLAYNIELAANKLGSRPFSAIVSNLGSRLTNRCICPAGRKMNFAQLQEMAKDVPEDGFEQGNENDLRHFECGDKVVPQKSWIMERRKDQCNCLAKPGVNFNDVCNKYCADGTPFISKTSYNDSLNSVSVKKSTLKKPWNYNVCRLANRLDSNKNMFSRSSRKHVATPAPVPVVSAPECLPPMTEEQPASIKATPRTNIANREKNLKEVLRNLHTEFSLLNDRYEELKSNLNNANVQNPEEQLKELEKLEKDLLNKEDEITMVMNLYKEVVALKQQIRLLKKQASQMSVTVTPYTRYKDYKDLNAAGHLTKLLRHIQSFQESLKTK